MALTKHRQSKEQELKDSRAALEAKLEADFKAASATSDPAEKLLKLEAIRAAANAEADSLSKDIANKSLRAGQKVAGAGLGVTAGATAAAGVVTLPIGGIGAVVIAPLLVASLATAGKRADAVKGKLLKKTGAHIEKMEKQEQRAEDLIAVTVAQNVEAISQSPYYAEALALPRIAEQFAEASAKHIVAQEAAADAAAAKAGNARKPAAPRQRKPRAKPDYARIRQAGL